MVLVVAAVAACSRDDGGGGADSAASAAPGYEPAAASAAPIAATRYAVAPLGQVGRVRGTVEVVGTIPPDSVVRPISDQEVCGDSLVDVTVEQSGGKLAGAVVWLAGVKSGKRPPMNRRYEMDIEGCQMSPRTQAAFVGGTLNVHNADRVQHRTRFVRQGSREPVAIVPYSDEGQLVPVTTALARPGVVEARCDLHPWGRAWVAVFDHPYFAVTSPIGEFALDSVPPGKYTLLAWHPRLGVVRDTVRVGGAEERAVVLRMTVR